MLFAARFMRLDLTDFDARFTGLQAVQVSLGREETKNDPTSLKADAETHPHLPPKRSGVGVPVLKVPSLWRPDLEAAKGLLHMLQSGALKPDQACSQGGPMTTAASGTGGFSRGSRRGGRGARPGPWFVPRGLDSGRHQVELTVCCADGHWFVAREEEAAHFGAPDHKSNYSYWQPCQHMVLYLAWASGVS